MNLLTNPSNSRFVARKCNTVKYQSNANYYVRNGIISSTEVLKSNLCNYNKVLKSNLCNYILVRGNIPLSQNVETRVEFTFFPPFIKFFL